MRLIVRLKEFLFGVDIVSVADAEKAFARAVETADRNGDGMLSIRELIDAFRCVIEEGCDGE